MTHLSSHGHRMFVVFVAHSLEYSFIVVSPPTPQFEIPIILLISRNGKVDYLMELIDIASDRHNSQDKIGYLLFFMKLTS